LALAPPESALLGINLLTSHVLAGQDHNAGFSHQDPGFLSITRARRQTRRPTSSGSICSSFPALRPTIRWPVDAPDPLPAGPIDRINVIVAGPSRPSAAMADHASRAANPSSMGGMGRQIGHSGDWWAPQPSFPRRESPTSSEWGLPPGDDFRPWERRWAVASTCCGKSLAPN